jgi:pimeloyl-ACP methyl ester carboxylesterase
MWRITAQDQDGRVRPVRAIEIPRSSRAVIEATVHDIMGGRTSESFDREIRSAEFLPGIDGIENWGRQAAELVPLEFGTGLSYGPIGKTQEGWEVPGLTFEDHIEFPVTVFHSPDALVADVTDVARLTLSADHQSEPLDEGVEDIVESRLYAGDSVVEQEVREDGNTPFALALPPPTGKPRTLVARFARWLGSKLTSDIKMPRDPFLHGRLRHSESRHPVLARQYPDIALAAVDAGLFRAIHKAPTGTAVLVFVHGTFSCALPNLALLHPLKIPSFRFEHDTFVEITENAARLVQAIRAFAADAKRIYLVAHSRGGLVARFAAESLGEDRVHVLTFGTPHGGTPLANGGRRLFPVLLAGGRAAIQGVFSWDPASLAGKLLLKWKLPQSVPVGIDDMRPASSFLQALNLRNTPNLRSWGGKYDLRRLTEESGGTVISEALQGAFHGESNDLIIPTASSLAAGHTRTETDCNHFGYFSIPQIRDLIRNLE